MKQLYEEIYRISQWCFCCPYSDISRGVGRYGKDNEEERQPLVGLSLPGLSEYRQERMSKSAVRQAILRAIIGDDAELSSNDVEEEDSDSPSEEPNEWEEWEKDYELSLKSKHYLKCYYLNKKGFTIDLDRDIIIPEDDRETLRLLDMISNCYSRECCFNRGGLLKRGSVDEAFRTAIAKIDFALMEQGKDLGKILEYIHICYYDRFNDIEKCGYSWDLIRYYRDKYGITIARPEESEDQDNLHLVEQSEGPFNNGNPFFAPEGISAVEEFIMRYSGIDGKIPISVLLVYGGYSNWVFNGDVDFNQYDPMEWAETNRNNWTRYEFTRWDEMREEVSREIKQRVNDGLELKKYICGLLTPFERYEYYANIRSDAHEFHEANALIYSYSNSYSLPALIYGQLWQEVVKEVRSSHNVDELSLDKYVTVLLNAMDKRVRELPDYEDCYEALFFNNRLDATEKYAGIIAGCLLAEGAKLEYMDYQDMCGVSLVKEMDSSTIAHAMKWTDELVFSYNPKRVKEGFRLPYSDDDQATQISPVVPMNIADYRIKYPKLFEYLAALQTEGYIDKEYVWIKDGHTNYHAGWASKIIIAKVSGVTHNIVSSIIKVTGLADHASKCQSKTDKILEIEACFKKHGLEV